MLHSAHSLFCQHINPPAVADSLLRACQSGLFRVTNNLHTALETLHDFSKSKDTGLLLFVLHHRDQLLGLLHLLLDERLHGG